MYLPEAALLVPLNAWIGELFDSTNVDRTVAALLDSQGVGEVSRVLGRRRSAWPRRKRG